MNLSIIEGEDLAIVGTGHPLQSEGRNGIFDETDRAVAHQAIHAASVEAERLVVRAAVVVDPEAFWWTTYWVSVVIHLCGAVAQRIAWAG